MSCEYARGGSHCHTARRWRAWRLLATVLSLLCAGSRTVGAWDSRTHRLITRLAIAALPSGELNSAFAHHRFELEEYSTEPDTVLRALYGNAEARRHYIDLEDFGADTPDKLDPDYSAMRRRYGVRTLERAGSLPWSIVAEGAAMEGALRDRDCAAVLRHAGYLAHYVGDSSQPLHTTRFYDGPTRDDRGMHARLEAAADDRISEIEAAATGQAHAISLTSVWPAVIAQIRESRGQITQVVLADRTARYRGGNGRAAYVNTLMALEQPLIVHQIVSAASLLAGIWTYEGHEARVTAVCSGIAPAPVSRVEGFLIDRRPVKIQ